VSTRSNDVQVQVHRGGLDAGGLRVAVVAARFNEAIVERLVDGAVGALVRHGASPDDVQVVWVPGAFELPVVLDKLAAGGEIDALVALGCVVRGSTPHFDYVAGECASGCAAVARQHGLPVSFGVLTTDTWEQAVERAGGKLGNKGAEAAVAAVETARVLRSL
jgi:6,7-dimethyl-8-ribityllumazine synthase